MFTEKDINDTKIDLNSYKAEIYAERLHEMKLQFIEIRCALGEKHTQITQNIVGHVTNIINVINELLNSTQIPPGGMLN
jgi:hypothetical protein